MLDKSITKELIDSYKKIIHELVQLCDIWNPIMYYKNHESNIDNINLAFGIFSNRFNIFEYTKYKDVSLARKLILNPECIGKNSKIILYLLFGKSKNKICINKGRNKEMYVAITSDGYRHSELITNQELLRFKQRILLIETKNVKVDDFFIEFLKSY